MSVPKAFLLTSVVFERIMSNEQELCTGFFCSGAHPFHRAFKGDDQQSKRIFGEQFPLTSLLMT